MSSLWGKKQMTEEQDPNNSEPDPEQGSLFELEFNEYTPSNLGTVHLSGFCPLPLMRWSMRLKV
ncbi:phage-like protein [Salmonella enterica subsp. arizonae]|uniref:Phage-like protein n=1 Tax=Salmonella enterica subsp. arizonae TaxID=59203 RepID=A0A379SVF7_SALER|nr:phage-like protein [Salmonella enterica subsp. arizonae]